MNTRRTASWKPASTAGGRRSGVGLAPSCRGRSPDLWYPAGERAWVDSELPGAYDLARRLCARCGWRQGCLAGALARGESDGMWGGATPAERARLLDGRVPAASATSLR
jgi:WhiB family transcriptional regulator, redox-sensing transcriptional regulator